MKLNIFYTAWLKESGRFIPDHTGIIEFLKSQGYTVESRLLSISEEQHTEDAFNVLNKIIEADIFIGEMSVPSQTLGFQLAYAISHNKPSLYLYHEGTQGKPISPLLGNPSRLLFIKDYNDENFQKRIVNFIEKASKQLLSDRITFVSTTHINEYLDRKTKKDSQSKGEVIRNILEKAIEQDS